MPCLANSKYQSPLHLIHCHNFKDDEPKQMLAKIGDVSISNSQGEDISEEFAAGVLATPKTNRFEVFEKE